MHPSELYKIFRFENNHWWFEGRRRLITFLFQRSCPDRDANILDVGCGTGRHLILLRDLRYRKTAGIDFSPLAISFCHQNGLSNVQEGDATRLQFPDASFDVLLVADALEHIEDDNGALREFWRVLKPGGSIILTVPAFRFLWSHHDVVLHHFRRYRLSDFRTLAKRHQFHIAYWTYFFCSIFPLVVGFRLVMKMMRLERTSDLEATTEPFNTILKIINRIEIRIVRHLRRLPYGTSLAVVLRKPVT